MENLLIEITKATEEFTNPTKKSPQLPYAEIQSLAEMKKQIDELYNAAARNIVEDVVDEMKEEGGKYLAREIAENTGLSTQAVAQRLCNHHNVRVRKRRVTQTYVRVVNGQVDFSHCVHLDHFINEYSIK